MNRLKFESSPYLLQHKDNPVHWWPWVEEALAEAKEKDQLILLSIGYSACHWCHVMEHECFENQQVAAYMNTHFVNIKVDREERPDLDQVYMEAVQLMGIRGGWPLNVFLLPSGEPIYGGTYFPKDRWLQVLMSLTQVYKEKRAEVLASGAGFVESLNVKDNERFNFGKSVEKYKYTKEELEILAEKLAKDFDVQDGGMQRSPKFPMPCLWNAVGHLAAISGNPFLEEHLQFTLGRMALGGIFDHVGGGWSRYSTDSYWKVPHFEKMLYDNAQLLQLYARFPSPLSPWAVEMTSTWLKREMRAPEGGYYAALDADSEGVEGKYYIWSRQELADALGTDAPYFMEEYGITTYGNWEHGNNILHLEHAPLEWNKLKESHEKLRVLRDLRVRPGLDNKIITSWNAMLVSAWATTDAESARALLDYLISYHCFSSKNEDGEEAMGCYHLAKNTRILGFLDDYATLIQACTDVYAATFEEKYLQIADRLVQYVWGNFADEDFFFYTDIQSEKLIARKKELFDNVIPSSNSLLAKALYFSGRYLGKQAYVELARGMMAKMQPLTLEDPQWLSNWVDLGLHFSAPQREWVVTGPEYRQWLQRLGKRKTSPSTLLLGAERSSALPHFEGRFSESTAWFDCEDSVCSLPVFSIDED
jgi:uncharacterized protein YyaL (SSP411 family)